MSWHFYLSDNQFSSYTNTRNLSEVFEKYFTDRIETSHKYCKILQQL